MAIVWAKTIKNKKYEVRTAGSSIRLFTDGVFHSQYNARNKISNGIWDLLVLPAFLQDMKSIKNILVLGVGGGAAIRMFLDHFQANNIVGIELNPIHLYIAKRFFKLQQKNVQLYEIEAKEWMKAYRGPKFDLIVEDLFSESDGEPIRAIDFNSQWFDLLSKNLSSGGMIIANFISRQELKQSEIVQRKKTYKAKYSINYFSDSRYDNCIAVFRKKPSSQNVIPRDKYQIIQFLPKAMANNIEYVSINTIIR